MAHATLLANEFNGEGAGGGHGIDRPLSSLPTTSTGCARMSSLTLMSSMLSTPLSPDLLYFVPIISVDCFAFIHPIPPISSTTRAPTRPHTCPPMFVCPPTHPSVQPAGRGGATYHEIFEQWHTLVAVEVAAVLSSVGDHLGHMSTCACVHALHVHTWEHVHVCMYWPKCFHSVPCSSRTASCVQSC